MPAPIAFSLLKRLVRTNAEEGYIDLAYCTYCAEEHPGVDPRARLLKCRCCGKLTVTGHERLLEMTQPAHSYGNTRYAPVEHSQHELDARPRESAWAEDQFDPKEGQIPREDYNRGHLGTKTVHPFKRGR